MLRAIFRFIRRITKIKEVRLQHCKSLLCASLLIAQGIRAHMDSLKGALSMPTPPTSTHPHPMCIAQVSCVVFGKLKNCTSSNAKTHLGRHTKSNICRHTLLLNHQKQSQTEFFKQFKTRRNIMMKHFGIESSIGPKFYIDPSQ